VIRVVVVGQEEQVFSANARRAKDGGGIAKCAAVMQRARVPSC